jgi:hypothetical protein
MVDFDTLLDEAIDYALGDDSAISPIWAPFPGVPQEVAYSSQADIIGYGGAAGGGKSDLGLGKAFTQFYRSIIFRREYPQLEGIISRGDEIQDGRCRFIGGEKKQWTTLDSRIVKVGAIEHEHDVQKYKGRARDFIVFDEAVDFTEHMVRFVMGWLRTDRPDIKPQVLLTFNPPTTPEGEWIVKFFAPWLDSAHQNPAQPGEMRWFVTVDSKDIEVPNSDPVEVDGDTYHPKSRTFFLATVEDNPVYMATGYDKHLESLPEPLRSQLRYGNFNITAKDDIWQCIPTAWIVEAQKRWAQCPKPDYTLRSMGVDPSRGGDDDTVIAKMYGNWFEVIRHAGADVPNGSTGARLVTNQMETPVTVWIDVIGYGASVYDHLAALPNTRAIPVNVGAGSTASDKTGRYGFFNLRSQLWWQFREALDPENGQDIMLPPDPQLRVDLRAPRYQIVGGKIKVESKEDVKKRIGRSTDAADAVQLAWYGARGAIRPEPELV